MWFIQGLELNPEGSLLLGGYPGMRSVMQAQALSLSPSRAPAQYPWGFLLCCLVLILDSGDSVLCYLGRDAGK